MATREPVGQLLSLISIFINSDNKMSLILSKSNGETSFDMSNAKTTSVGNTGHLETPWHNGYTDLRFSATPLNRGRFEWIRNIIYLLNKLERKLFWRQKKKLLVYISSGMFSMWVLKNEKPSPLRNSSLAFSDSFCLSVGTSTCSPIFSLSFSLVIEPQSMAGHMAS